MILGAILIITLVILLLFGVLAVSIGGAAFLIIFGDVFLCAGLILFMIFKTFKKRNMKNRVWKEWKRNNRGY